MQTVINVCGLEGAKEDKERARAIVSERDNAARMVGDIRYRLFNIESAIEDKLKRLYSMKTDRYEDIICGEKILFDVKILIDKTSLMGAEETIRLYKSGLNNEFYRFLLSNVRLEEKCEALKRAADINRGVALLSKRDDIYSAVAAHIGGSPSIRKCAEILANRPEEADKIMNRMLAIIKKKVASGE